MRIAVLGGGVAGTVAARELAASEGFEIDLLEQKDTLGGLHRSIELEGLNYDIGTFLFDRSHTFLQTFPELYRSFVQTEHLGLSITGRGTIDHYPMTIRGYLRDHGPIRFSTDILDLMRCKLTCRKRETLVEYLQYYLGRGIYGRSGLKKYIERLYAAPDSEVDLEFALQRIPSLPEECGLRRNLGRLVREIWHHPTKEGTWGCYVRPREGFQAVYATVERVLKQKGVNVRKGVSIRGVERTGAGYLVHLEGEPSERYDRIVSTIPVAVMMRLLGLQIACPPETIRLVSLCYRLRGDLGIRNAGMVCNFTQRGYWKRFNVFSSYYGKADGEEYFVVECPARMSDTRDEEFFRHDFEQHIAELPVLNGTLRFQGSVITPHAYPFLRRADLEYVAAAREALTDAGIDITGRQGTFRYTSADATARLSRDLARNLAAECA